MRYAAAEKLEIIRLVEQSSLSVRKPLTSQDSNGGVIESLRADMGDVEALHVQVPPMLKCFFKEGYCDALYRKGVRFLARDRN